MEKQRGFGVHFIVYFIALIVATLSYSLLKITAMDPITGFIVSETFFSKILGIIFPLSLLLPILFWFLITIKRRAYHDFPISYRHISSSIFAILTGVSIVVYSLFLLPNQILSPHHSEFQGKLLLLLCFILGIIAGISMIAGGVRPRYGIAGKPGAMLGFFPALWQLTVILLRFNSFIAITTVYDVTLVVLFMCFAAMFLIGQSRIIFGLGIRNGKTYAIPAGLSVSLAGLTFVFSNLIYSLINQKILFHVPMSVPEFLYILFLSCYSAIFLAGYVRSIRIV